MSAFVRPFVPLSMSHLLRQWVSGCLLLLTDVYRSQFASWFFGSFVLPSKRVSEEKEQEKGRKKEGEKARKGERLLESVNDARNWAKHLLLNGPQSNEPSAREKSERTPSRHSSNGLCRVIRLIVTFTSMATTMAMVSHRVTDKVTRYLNSLDLILNEPFFPPSLSFSLATFSVLQQQLLTLNSSAERARGHNGGEGEGKTTLHNNKKRRRGNRT